MENVEIASMAPILGLVSQVVFLIGIIVVISMLKNLIAHGVSLAIADWLMKHADDSWRERVCRWLADKGEILDYLKKIEAQNRGVDKS